MAYHTIEANFGHNRAWIQEQLQADPDHFTKRSAR